MIQLWNALIGTKIKACPNFLKSGLVVTPRTNYYYLFILYADCNLFVYLSDMQIIIVIELVEPEIF